MFQQKLLVDEPDDIQIEIDGIEVQQRDAEFVRRGDRDLPGVAEAIRHQMRHETPASSFDRA